MMTCWVIMAVFGRKRAAFPPSPKSGGSKRHARVTAINNWFDDRRVSDNMGHFLTFQVKHTIGSQRIFFFSSRAELPLLELPGSGKKGSRPTRASSSFTGSG
jgi:hypothetical protein